MDDFVSVDEIRVERLKPFFQLLNVRSSRPLWGRVIEADGNTIVSDGPLCSIGECCEIVEQQGAERHFAEVIGFRGRQVVTMPLVATHGIRFGDRIAGLASSPTISLGEGLRGRVLDGLGRPMDGAEGLRSTLQWPLDGAVRHPFERVPIREPLQTGIRVLDGLLTIGKGQRLGIFGGSGVGKSTLIGMMTRNTAADITVVGLVGERGREVREFVDDALGKEGMERSVVVVSTSDQSPLLRMRAAMSATSIAEYYAAEGKDVLLVLDSLTRYAMAAREVGLAAGEPPTSKGYTPSVFTRLAKLVERAGNFTKGSITALYTVLMEGDDQQDPVVDAVRSFLDGHVVLSRRIASAGQYPPVDVVDSLSRLMPAVTRQEHLSQAMKARRLLSTYARSEDLIRIGAYNAGSDIELDRAIELMPALLRFLEQRSDERVTMTETISALGAISL